MDGVVTMFVLDAKWFKSKEIILRITIELSEGGGFDLK